MLIGLGIPSADGEVRFSVVYRFESRTVFRLMIHHFCLLTEDGRAKAIDCHACDLGCLQLLSLSAFEKEQQPRGTAIPYPGDLISAPSGISTGIVTDCPLLDVARRGRSNPFQSIHDAIICLEDRQLFRVPAPHSSPCRVCLHSKLVLYTGY